MPPEREWSAVSAALLKAQEAVQADHACMYDKAVSLYKESILLLDAHVLVTLSDEEREKLMEIITMYTNRVDLIYSQIPELADNEVNINEFEFKESLPIGSLPDPAPASIYYRPFWMMRLLAQTMTRGGYMTPKLYVPRNVWFQLGAKFTAIEAKFTACETVLIYLLKLKDEDITDKNMLAKQLEEFCQQLDTVQNALARKLRYINEIKSDKQVTKLAQVGNIISKSVERLQANVMKLRIDDDSAYIELLIKIFETSQFLEQWMTKFDNEPVIISKLKRISEFFYSVMCTFVIRDFNILLERYMKKTRQSFVQI